MFRICGTGLWPAPGNEKERRAGSIILSSSSGATRVQQFVKALGDTPISSYQVVIRVISPPPAISAPPCATRMQQAASLMRSDACLMPSALRQQKELDRISGRCYKLIQYSQSSRDILKGLIGALPGAVARDHGL